MFLMSSRTEVVVPSFLNFAPRYFHPIAMISECLEFVLRVRWGVGIGFDTHWDAKLENVSATMLSSLSFDRISRSAWIHRSSAREARFHESCAQEEGHHTTEIWSPTGVQLPFSQAGIWSLANKALASLVVCLKTPIVPGTLNPEILEEQTEFCL